MAGVELATAYLTLVPSLRGASKSIAAQLGGVDVSKAGERMGRSLTDSIGKAFSTEGLAKFETSVKAAEKGLRDAMEGSADATKKVAIAQQQLDEAREKYGASSVQAQNAEIRLSQAQRNAANAAAKEADAQGKLERAEMELAQATRSANTVQQMQESVLGRVAAAASNASSKLSSAGAAFSNAGAKMQGIGAAMTAGVTAPMVAGAAAVGGFAIKTASAAETTEISFTTMLGSAEAAESMMTQLSDFAAHTPFELSGLQSATRQLLAYGFSAEEVIPMLTAVGDATAALGTGQAGIESVTRALGQMQTRGKVSAEEMLQLTEAGIPAWEYLARAIGTDTAGAMDAVTKGAVTASEGIAAITKGMEDDFGGMMESQSKTVEGLMSNLSDAIQQPLMELRNSDAYDRFAESLGRIVDAAGPFVESLLPHMESGLDAVSGIMDKAADAMDAFANMSEDGQANIIGIATAAAGAGPALTLVGTGARAAGALMQGASKIFGLGSTQLQKVATAAAEAAVQASAAGTATTNMGTGATSAATGATKLNGALKILKVGLSGLGIGLAVTALAAIVGKFQEAAEHAQLMEDATKGLSGAVSEMAGELGTAKVDVDAAAQSLAGLNEASAETLSGISADASLLDTYIGTIERLADKSGLSASEQWELAYAVEGYNSITGSTVEIIDAINGKLSTSTEELQANADAWERNAKAQALQEQAQEYYKESFDYSQQISQLENELAGMDQGTRIDFFGLPAYQDKQSIEYEQKKQQLEEITQLANTADASFTASMAQAEAMALQLDSAIQTALVNLPPSMQGIGLDVAQQLAAGIQGGTVTANEAASFLTFSVGSVISALPPDMQAKGAQAVSSLAAAISSGSITTQQAAQILKAAISGEVSTLPPELRPYGSQAAQALGAGIQEGALFAGSGADAMITAIDGKLAGFPAQMESDGSEGGTSFAEGVGSAEGEVSSAASTLSDATVAMTDNSGNAFSWGSEMGANFASGLSSQYGAVSSAASSLASAAAGPLHHSTPDFGPLKDDDEWGYHLGQNFADGMSRAIPLIEAESERMAGAASFAGSYAMSSMKRSAYAASLPLFGEGFGSFDQTINFNQPIRSPAQVASMMRRYATYGLAGAR